MAAARVAAVAVPDGAPAVGTASAPSVVTVCAAAALPYGHVPARQGWALMPLQWHGRWHTWRRCMSWW